MKNRFVLGLMVSAFIFATPALRAEDSTMGEKAHEAAHDTKRGAKKAMRKAGEKGCEMVNGKMECLGKKAKNRMKDAADKVEDVTD